MEIAWAESYRRSTLAPMGRSLRCGSEFKKTKNDNNRCTKMKVGFFYLNNLYLRRCCLRSIVVRGLRMRC